MIFIAHSIQVKKDLVNKMRPQIFILLFYTALTAACSSFAVGLVPPNQHVITSVPVYPVDQLKYVFEGQAFRLTVPIATTGHPLTLIDYKTPIETSGYITLTENIFPTDVYVAILPGLELPKVFLNRSPQSSCLLEWLSDSKIYKADCDGSEFKLDGTYLSGPSSRNLDEFPVSIREGMIWITNTVTLGKPVVSTPN